MKARGGGNLALATCVLALAVTCGAHEFWRIDNAGRASSGLAMLGIWQRVVVFVVGMILWHRLLAWALPAIWPLRFWRSVGLGALVIAAALMPEALTRSPAAASWWARAHDAVLLNGYVYLGLYRPSFVRVLAGGAVAIAIPHIVYRLFVTGGLVRAYVSRRIQRWLDRAPEGGWYHERHRIHRDAFARTFADQMYEQHLRERALLGTPGLTRAWILRHTPSGRRHALNLADGVDATSVALHENLATCLADSMAPTGLAQRTLEGALIAYLLAGVSDDPRFAARFLELCTRLRTAAAARPLRAPRRQWVYARACLLWATLPVWLRALVGFPPDQRQDDAIEIGGTAALLDLILSPPVDSAALLPALKRGLSDSPAAQLLSWLAVSRWMDQTASQSEADIDRSLRILDGYYELCGDGEIGALMERQSRSDIPEFVVGVRRLQAWCWYRVGMAWYVYGDTVTSLVGASDHAAMCARRAAPLCSQAGESDLVARFELLMPADRRRTA